MSDVVLLDSKELKSCLRKVRPCLGRGNDYIEYQFMLFEAKASYLTLVTCNGLALAASSLFVNLPDGRWRAYLTEVSDIEGVLRSENIIKLGVEKCPSKYMPSCSCTSLILSTTIDKEIISLGCEHTPSDRGGWLDRWREFLNHDSKTKVIDTFKVKEMKGVLKLFKNFREDPLSINIDDDIFVDLCSFARAIKTLSGEIILYTNKYGVLLESKTSNTKWHIAGFREEED